MVEVGIRELKSRLSYYVQLMRAGETIAIKMRDHIVGFLTNMKDPKKADKRKQSRLTLQRRIEQLKEEGFLISGGLCKHRRVKPVKMLPGGPSTTEIIRKMRDEEDRW